MKCRVALMRALALVAASLIFAGASNAQKTPPVAPLDLNSATVEQLEQLPGIGPTLAKAIVRFREKSGPLQRVDDLLAVRGVSKNKLKKLRPYVVVIEPEKKSSAP